MIAGAPDTQITFIPAKREKAGTVKTYLYTDPGVNTSTVPLFTVSATTLEAVKAREAEPRDVKPRSMLAFYFLNKGAVTQTCSINKTLLSSICNKSNLPSSSLASITVRAEIFLLAH